MIRWYSHKTLWTTWLLCSLALPLPANAADLTIGYLQQKNDPRYGKKQTYAQYLMQPLGRPYSGAKIALQEIKFHGVEAGVAFKLKRTTKKTAAHLIKRVEAMNDAGIHFFVADLPAATLSQVAAATASRNLLLLNISARENPLRQEQCQAHMLHLIPSYAMLGDALAQFLVFRKWRKVLALEGPSTDDKQWSEAFTRSAKKYGLKIIEQKTFKLSNDPRNRHQNNPLLLTSGSDYDTVFVADTKGEFARGLPYHTVKPQLVVGSEGLAPAAWHWAWERHGAPQLENRFQKAYKRPMRGFDWAAWQAVKAIAKAVQRTGSADFKTLKQYLLSDTLVLDGFKGYRANFRPWNLQLRQPILLTTHNWVVDRAPLEGFLHQKNNLDTLGYDERESQCKF